MKKENMTRLNSTLTGGLIFRILVSAILVAVISTNLFASGIKIDKILFEGNKDFKSSELKSIIKSEEKKPFNSKLLRVDKTILTNFYLGKGFLNVWIESEIHRKADKVSILFRINEGKQYRLGGIEVSGGELLTNDRIRNYIKLKKNQIYDQQSIDEGLNKIERYYFNHGKPYVVINQDKSEQDSLILVDIKINEGATVHIVDLEYAGLRQVKSFIVRRELEIHKGDIYSRDEIEKSQRNIYSTGLFDFVGMELRAADSTRSQAALIVKLVEKKSRWIGAQFGVAYEQEILYGGTFDFTFSFGHRNLFGTARTITLEVIPSLSYDFNSHSIINPKNQYSLYFVEPWIGYTRTPGIFRASYYQVRPVNSSDYNYFTSSFQVRHDFPNAWKASATLAFNNVKILEKDTLGEAFFNQTNGQDFIYSISTDVTRDKRDNYLSPMQGYLTETTVKFAYSNSRNQYTGATSVNRFFKFTAQWIRYQAFPLRKGWVLATRIRAGNILELGKLSQIPILERFYLGGASTVRGYREQLLGPVVYDENGQNPQAIGGKLMVLGNVEVRIPIFWLFWGEIFTDAGNVWLENRNFKFNSIKPSSGAGLAIMTPLGPVRFDYGIKLRPTKYESPGEFHISISFAY